MKPAIKILFGFVETSGGNRKMETEATKETGSVRGTKEEGIYLSDNKGKLKVIENISEHPY